LRPLPNDPTELALTFHSRTSAAQAKNDLVRFVTPLLFLLSIPQIAPNIPEEIFTTPLLYKVGLLMHSVEWIEYQSESEVSAQSNTAKICLKLRIVLLARAYFVKMNQPI
jgi:hypothetical protein